MAVTYLVLADGSVHTGEAFGAVSDAHGEVVFNTSRRPKASMVLGTDLSTTSCAVHNIATLRIFFKTIFF